MAEQASISVRTDKESLNGYAAMLGEIQRSAESPELSPAIRNRIRFFIAQSGVRVPGWQLQTVRMPDGLCVHVEASPLIAGLLKLLRTGAVTHQALDELLIASLQPARRKS